jgi:hypothetical protein
MTTYTAFRMAVIWLNPLKVTDKMDDIDLSNAELYAADSRGVYIPQYFAESVMRDCVANVTDWQWQQLDAGPDADGYWDAWSSVCDNAVISDRNGKEWTLYQDGDLWIMPRDA